MHSGATVPREGQTFMRDSCAATSPAGTRCAKMAHGRDLDVGAGRVQVAHADKVMKAKAPGP